MAEKVKTVIGCFFQLPDFNLPDILGGLGLAWLGLELSVWEVQPGIEETWIRVLHKTYQWAMCSEASQMQIE